ncbi:hypothetical protein [Actinoplanes regularis]|uniref:hypothetical protein n=1 Tax=Actinoplanes regularis TaxID=52697 RepID=UPI001EF2E950|nr:hypothetical protein [Actinoplanes regularis]
MSAGELPRSRFWWHPLLPPSVRGYGTASRPAQQPAEKVEHARLLKAQGDSLATLATKTGIPKTSLHRYLTGEPTAQPA